LENIKNAEDSKTYDKINADIKIQNNELSEMFIKQDEGIKDMAPCLVSLERIHKNNFNLLEPIEHLTDEVICHSFQALIKKLYFFVILILVYCICVKF